MSRKFNFFQGQGIVGNSVMCQGKMKFCKNVREMSGNFTFQPDEARMFGIRLGCLVQMYFSC